MAASRHNIRAPTRARADVVWSRKQAISNFLVERASAADACCLEHIGDRHVTKRKVLRHGRLRKRPDRLVWNALHAIELGNPCRKNAGDYSGLFLSKCDNKSAPSIGRNRLLSRRSDLSSSVESPTSFFSISAWVWRLKFLLPRRALQAAAHNAVNCRTAAGSLWSILFSQPASADRNLGVNRVAQYHS